MEIAQSNRPAWLDHSPLERFRLSWETLIYIVIVLLAVVTRFYLLEPRVMSHDENSHVYYSWLLYKGQGYAHDPVTHGPFQFHIVALSYFLFGDSDTSARIPAVLFSIATVAFMWYYRRYLGRAGALFAALMLVISPYMLYYGRYVRNESFVALWGVLTLWAILRHLETGEPRYMLWLSFASIMHFTTKETNYIYTAEALLFMGLYFVYRVTAQPWPRPEARNRFLVSLIGAISFLALGGALLLITLKAAPKAGADAAAASAALNPSSLATPLALLVLGGVALLTAFYFLVNGHQEPGTSSDATLRFMIALIAIPVLLGIALGYGTTIKADNVLLNPPAAEPGATANRTDALMGSLYAILSVLPAIAIGAGMFFAGQQVMKLPNQIWPAGKERVFDLLLVTSSLMLPGLSAFAIKVIGNPTDYSTVGILRSATVLIPFALLSIGVGLAWQRKWWLTNAALFYGIFAVLYTTVFTNGQGFFTGIIGGLGYWLEQQGVNRGSQPWYYYALVQVPFYEFLPALGTILALVIVVARWIKTTRLPKQEAQSAGEPIANQPAPAPISDPAIQPPPVLALLSFWAAGSLFAFSYAGEKMPWLTVHITLPLILLAGWAIGQVVEGINWETLRQQRLGVVILTLLVFITSMVGVGSGFVSATPPFQGKDLVQLQASATFLMALIAAGLSGWALIRLLKDWPVEQFVRLITAGVFAFLAVITARSAFMASYTNYDRPGEYLVYAHCGPGVKEALAQIEEISRRTTGGLDVKVAFDNETTYPYWWYLRNYPNQHYFAAAPTRDLRDYPLILVGDANYSKIEPVVGKNYYEFEYIRIWWPMQDYFDLTPTRLWYALSNSPMRAALFNIWWNRDYKEYASLTSELKGYPVDMSLPNWQPSGKMKLYVRKDVAAQIWNYGAAPSAQDFTASSSGLDSKLEQHLLADRIVGQQGAENGQFNNPRGVALAPDGSIYIADSGNHRIQHLSAEGAVLQVWGSQSPKAGSSAPQGTFSEPWDVAVGPDGAVYVADTWNHRIQKFTADGEYLAQWGYGISQNLEDPYGLYGPRGIVVDSQGRVMITDTGNKRLILYDQNGEFIAQIGEGGMAAGQFDEPVGLALDAQDHLYVADVWNQRVQSLTPELGGSYKALLQWDVDGWYGKGITNYPYISADSSGSVFITDPEAARIQQFSIDGKLVRYWGVMGSGADGLNLPTGIAADSQGGVWVTDTGNHRLLHYTLP